jgi:hypothetical protein
MSNEIKIFTKPRTYNAERFHGACPAPASIDAVGSGGMRGVMA